MIFRCLKKWNWDQKIFPFTWGIYKGSRQPLVGEKLERDQESIDNAEENCYQNKEYMENINLYYKSEKF